MANVTSVGLAEASDDVSIEPIISFLVPAVFGLVILFGTIGNSLVIAVFALNHSMRNSTNVLILNLASADLAFVLFCVPATAVQYSISTWPFGEAWCKVVMYLQYVSALGSVWTLVLMAVERFLAVVYPVHAAVSIRNIKNAALSIMCLWLGILLSQLHIFASHVVHDYEFGGSNRSACVFQAHLNKSKYSQLFFRLHFWSFNFSAFFLPLGITSVLYALMVKALWRNKLKMTLSESSIHMKRRITTMVASVTLVFTICWLPQNVWFLWQAAIFPTNSVTDNSSLAIQITVQILSYTNSCLNPLLYGTLSTNFRHGFENAVSLAFRRKARHRLQRQESSKAREARSIRKPSVRHRLMKQISKTNLLRRQATQEAVAVGVVDLRPTLDGTSVAKRTRKRGPKSRLRLGGPGETGGCSRSSSPPRTDSTRIDSGNFSRAETFHLSESEPLPVRSPSSDDETQEQFV